MIALKCGKNDSFLSVTDSQCELPRNALLPAEVLVKFRKEKASLLSMNPLDPLGLDTLDTTVVNC